MSFLVKKTNRKVQSSDSAIANFLASIHCDLNVPVPGPSLTLCCTLIALLSTISGQF